MIILHAASLDQQLLLWGEMSADSRLRPTKRRRTSSKRPASTPYPYDAGWTELAAALQEGAVDLGLNKRRTRSVAVWLPTRGKNPIPSSPLIAEPPRSRAKLRLAPWRITTYPLATAEAIHLLCACLRKEMLAGGVVIGSDLRYWTEMLRFAGSLVARQQYLPDLVRQGKGYRAQWTPVFAGNDAEHLVQLARQMPAIARALTLPDASSPPETASHLILKRWITRTVDHLVRSAVGEGVGTQKRHRTEPVPASVHDAWLHALRTPEGMVTGEKEALNQLAVQVREWQRPIRVTAAAPFRLCFRLEEPIEEATAGKGKKNPAATWYVRYLLQPHDDPSLLLPLSDFWQRRGRSALLLKRYRTGAHEYLLSALGQAAGICPYIAESLKVATPAGYTLDTVAAYEFLTEKAMALEQSGFGVLLPSWWTRKGTKTRFTVRARVKSPRLQSKGGLSLESLVQFDWEVALGEEKLSLRELEALARMKTPLVRLRGRWVEVNAAEIQAAIAFWKQKASETTTVRDVMQMALGAREGPAGFSFEGVKATGWVGTLLRQLEGRVAWKELIPPRGFVGTLRPYQVRGYSWLAFLRQWGLGACLADDMGLGKTIQTLTLIQRDRERGEKRPVLLVCPTSLIYNWQKEAARFTPELPVLVHHGIGRGKGKAFVSTAQKQAMVITSYGLLQRDLAFLQRVSWAGVVLDEAQNIKNPETKQSRAARALQADYRIALTGTPVENNVGDLWAIMEFLNPGFLGSQTEFRRRFFLPIQAGYDPEAAKRLQHMTGPFILRRLKTDRSIMADLPEKLEMKVFCSLTREQASLYTAVLQEMEDALDAVEGIQRKGMILATLSKLKQICNHPAQFLGDNSSIPGRSGKLNRLTEMLEEILTVGERALIFSQFAEMGKLLHRYLQETFGQEVLFLYGGVPKRRRDQMVERFQAEDGPPLFILSLKAGGTGLNLTAATHVFHFDRWWNPAVENQATDRVFRIGQRRNVQVHKFLCAGTLEERIDQMIERKQALAETVVGTGEGWLTELSNEELKAIFSLQKDAIGE